MSAGYALIGYGSQDVYLSYEEESQLEKFSKLGQYKKIVDYLNTKTYTKQEIKNAINVAPNLKIVELLASYLNKRIMKKIKDIEIKRLIWKYTFNWLTKPITNDGLLGIDVRLGIKHLSDLDCAPLILDLDK